VALVTGGARRTGRAIALKLAEAGASVVVNAFTSGAQAASTAVEIETLHGPGRAMPFVADVGDGGAVRAMVDAAVQRFGGLDILVNNASIRFHAALEETSLEQWRRILRVTLDGSFLCAQAAAPYLTRSPAGTIVNIGGVVAHIGARGASAIMTAKAGVEGLTRALACELGPNVTVNCILPASMRSSEDPPQRASTLQSFYQHERVPLARPGSVEEVAGAIVALCAPPWRYMTGQMIHVNGGVWFGS
jgi:3-oxoacyl-[acyl-carrier protein] reductase